MSLLNQVLQDLEQRNVENIAEPYRLNNIKAVNSRQRKAFYLPTSLILFTSIIVIISYSLNTKEPSDLVFKPQQLITNTVDKLKLTLKSDHPRVKVAIPSKQTNGISTDSILKNTDFSALAVKPGLKTIYKQQTLFTTKQTEKKPKQTNSKTREYKKRSNRQKANRLFKTAEKQHNIQDRQNDLEKVLFLYPQHVNARLLLSNTLLQQGLTDKVAALLDQGLIIYSQNLQFINLRSQLFLQKKQPQAALKILQQVDNDYVKDEIYLSLLAAVYQQTNASFSSLQTYKKLLKINPEKAEYWLGLAIALEKQDDTDKTLAAYQQALNRNTLNAVVVSYIKQRISLLK